MDDKQRYQRGMEVRRKVLGDAHVDKTLQKLTPQPPSQLPPQPNPLRSQPPCPLSSNALFCVRVRLPTQGLPGKPCTSTTSIYR